MKDQYFNKFIRLEKVKFKNLQKYHFYQFNLKIFVKQVRFFTENVLSWLSEIQALYIQIDIKNEKK